MAGNYELVVSPDGMPALVLQGASVRVPVESGNPNREIGTGRFGRGQGQRDRRRAGSERRVGGRREGDGAPSSSQLRRRDAIVDAAREIEDLTDERAMREFMRRRWAGTRAMTDADVISFISEVRRQRIEDVLDHLDNRVRAGVLRKAKVVRVDFPRGWVKATLRGLSDDEVGQVLNRLRTRGWTEQQVRQHVVQRFDDDRRRLARLRADIEVED